MNDYYGLLKEYQELQTNFTNNIYNMNIIAYYFQSFGLSISSLNKSIKSNAPINNDNLIYFTKLYSDLLLDLKNMNLDNSDIIIPIQQMNESQNETKKRIFGLFNEIKSSLFEGKQKINIAKKEYLEFLKENKEIQQLEKNDVNLWFEGKKINYFMLYKYEVDKMNEKINKNNKVYNELINELELMNMFQQNTFNKSFLGFAKVVGAVGKKFIEFEKNINDKFENFINANLNNNNNEDKIRFPSEILEEKLYDIPENINDIINNNIQRQNSSFDFEILRISSSEDTKINNLMEGIIKKLSSEEEITSTEISELIENIKYEHSKYSYLFLEKVKNFYKNRLIICKNRQNFIHFSNFLNNLSAEKEDIKIFNEIFELCKMINYDGVFMSSMIQKQNPFLSSKTFWMNLIRNNLIIKVSELSGNLLKINNKVLEKEIKDLKFEDKNNLLKREDRLLNFFNQVYGYKKLNKKQKTELENQTKEIVLLVIAQSITNMCNFLVSEKTILDIIHYFVEIFDLGIESLYYFKIKLSVSFKKNYLKVNDNYEEMKDKYGFLMSNNELIILNVSKFLPKDNYIKIFNLNKDIKSKLRMNLLKYQLNKFDISIDKRIKIWEIFLKLDEIKKEYNYSEIKNHLKNIDKSKIPRAFNIIDLDLGRTPLFRDDINHKKAASNILKSINTLDCCIDYYQGINFVILFIYQILNHDEEKTFYFMLGLEKNTKYHELFKDDLAELVIFFKVFEKILEINIPEIFYAFLDKQIMTQFFSTSWFVTLFTSEIVEFTKEKAPKFLLMAFESFIFGGWSGIINAGLSLCYYNRSKILEYNGNDLMKYMIADINKINNFSEEEFEKIHKSFLIYQEKVSENYIKKLREIIKFEEVHKQLKSKEL